MIAPLELLDFLWTLWLVAWLVAARWTAKTVVRQPVAARLSTDCSWGPAPCSFSADWEGSAPSC